MTEKKDDNDTEAPPLGFGCEDHWSWNRRDRSHEVRLYGPGLKIAHFHPNWSSGTAGVRGTRALDAGRYYWELKVSQRIFGTSMMFGIATRQARLHANTFTNLLGEDNQGWGLSHKGLLWHGGKWSPFTKPFRENEPTTIGILFDGVAGTLTYYKDGQNLGVAFRGLHKCTEPLYPFVCSTAAKTEMILNEQRREFVNLQDRCRNIIVKRVKSIELLENLHLPQKIFEYLAEALMTDDSKLFQPFHQLNRVSVM
ncbi:SPRY domain-containing SOCS box protein, putative [Pediculus humanus corporis]|uniref:SPRY domain-containing SOCS box protein 3 n=2 Tax=Pediculus humanus subsp. corporis TaxID=121224 RepID=E0VSL7_PEDHC|nr:SPRY domain-containing SOCS box protein, putative [Pediculus humanus corporis]EEB16373.1 SPRY domain-containing SOCS box protein, putative [Pediculus humanus corporis]